MQGSRECEEPKTYCYALSSVYCRRRKLLAAGLVAEPLFVSNVLLFPFHLARIRLQVQAMLASVSVALLVSWALKKLYDPSGRSVDVERNIITIHEETSIKMLFATPPQAWPSTPPSTPGHVVHPPATVLPPSPPLSPQLPSFPFGPTLRSQSVFRGSSLGLHLRNFGNVALFTHEGLMVREQKYGGLVNQTSLVGKHVN